MGRKSDARKRLMATAHQMIWSYSYGTVTVEKICEQAGVRKGSFYYFFDSKSDLALAAILAWWEDLSGLVHELTRPDVPPLQRIRKYFDTVAQHQIEAHKKDGRILGCPLFNLGSEISTQDERIRVVIQEILGYLTGYFEEAIRQSQLSGEIEGNDAARKGRLLWAFYEGTLTRARIENNPELLRTLSADVGELIRAPRADWSARSSGQIEKRSDLETAPRPRFELGGRAKKSQSPAVLGDLIQQWKHARERVVLTDSEGLVEWVNEPFVRMCGYSLEELRGRKPGAVLQGPKSDRGVVELLRQAVRSVQSCRCEIINYKKDGRPYPVHIALDPVFKNAKLAGFLAIEKELGDEAPLATPVGIA